jgi:glutamate synthase domain-containing protein 3
VEGVGDHGCEYMTKGTVVVIGRTGRNFAAGMSGGFAYVLDERGDFAKNRCNKDMVDLEPLAEPADVELVKSLLAKHKQWTGSVKAEQVLTHWDAMQPKFVKVYPKDYRRVMEAQKKAAGSKEGALAGAGS